MKLTLPKSEALGLIEGLIAIGGLQQVEWTGAAVFRGDDWESKRDKWRINVETGELFQDNHVDCADIPKYEREEMDWIDWVHYVTYPTHDTTPITITAKEPELASNVRRALDLFPIVKDKPAHNVSYSLLEALADIAFAAGWEKYNGDVDSRALMARLVDWAEEFERLNAGVEWGIDDRDYIEEIDDFAMKKMKEN